MKNITLFLFRQVSLEVKGLRHEFGRFSSNTKAKNRWSYIPSPPTPSSPPPPSSPSPPPPSSPTPPSSVSPVRHEVCLHSSTIVLYWSRSYYILLQFINPIIIRSSPTQSIHLTAGLSSGVMSSGVRKAI